MNEKKKMVHFLSPLSKLTSYRKEMNKFELNLGEEGLTWDLEARFITLP